jgi:hypothetical protein
LVAPAVRLGHVAVLAQMTSLPPLAVLVKLVRLVAVLFSSKPSAKTVVLFLLIICRSLRLPCSGLVPSMLCPAGPRRQPGAGGCRC